jgi:hypothetical protein
MSYIRPLVLVEALGKELARRGLSAHLELCRRTWLAMESGKGDPPWSMDTVRELAAALQLPPYERLLAVRGPRDGCGSCGPKLTVVWMELPDRHLMLCRACGGRWLVFVGTGL